MENLEYLTKKHPLCTGLAVVLGIKAVELGAIYHLWPEQTANFCSHIGEFAKDYAPLAAIVAASCQTEIFNSLNALHAIKYLVRK